MALKYHAGGIILAHNNPNGNLTPRQSDIETTKQLALVGSLLQIPVRDHLMLTSKGYLSFQKEGLMPKPM